jgi:hypothetical protein
MTYLIQSLRCASHLLANKTTISGHVRDTGYEDEKCFIPELKKQENEGDHLVVITQVHGTCRWMSTSSLHAREAADLYIGKS